LSIARPTCASLLTEAKLMFPDLKDRVKKLSNDIADLDRIVETVYPDEQMHAAYAVVNASMLDDFYTLAIAMAREVAPG
jgi:hypothetical protein